MDKFFLNFKAFATPENVAIGFGCTCAHYFGKLPVREIILRQNWYTGD